MVGKMTYLLPFCLVLIAVIVEVRSVVVVGSNSGGGDDAVSVAICPTGTVGVECSCTPAGQCDGSYFTDDVTCKAFHRYGYSSGHSNAHATCLPLLVRKTSTAYSAGPHESCDAEYTLMSCQVYSPWAQNTPSHMTPISSGRDCSASSGCTNCKVQAVCVYSV
ncbi:uncharacterized protein LOC135492952 [Lineus longissimus]|uniref:uncharacterized protein LOC135492952 n=1 Tax=Lineus longissimus TaxID=88925 RepID=UPI00315DC6A9